MRKVTDDDINALMKRVKAKQDAEAVMELPKVERIPPGEGYDQAKVRDDRKAVAKYDGIVNTIKSMGLPQRVHQPKPRTLVLSRKLGAGPGRGD